MSVVENAKEQLLSSGSWSVDPAHSTIEFRVRHMRHPEISFQARGVRFNGDDGEFALPGELTIKGVTHPKLETGSVLAGETVDLHLDVAAVRVD